MVISNGAPDVQIGTFCSNIVPFGRRDFYKITFFTGEAIVTYADRTVNVGRPALIFTIPDTPYSWQPISENSSTYRCVFNEDFAIQENRSLLKYQMLQPGFDKIYFLNDSQCHNISAYFRTIYTLLNSLAPLANEKVFFLLHLIICEVLPFHSGKGRESPNDGVVKLFFQKLENQFRFMDRENPIALRNPSDFAKVLSVHPNHLNRVIKQHTGKTVSEIISTRIVSEARQQLLHSGWSVAQTAYALGFENPAYFNLFFKKITGQTPGSIKRGV